MRISTFAVLPLIAMTLGLTVQGCANEDEDYDDSAESELRENSAESRAVLALVNDTRVTAEELIGEARVTTSIARRVIGYRNGADARPATADDNPFDSLAELKGQRVGAVTLDRLVAYAKAKGLLGAGNIEVVFSPQAPESTHTVKVAQLIAQARKSVDIAMYSFSDAGISAALQAATARGVKVRFIFETATDDRRLAADALTNSKSAQLEKRGVDVRYVNKIMHHKFAIIDGPRDSEAAAETARLVSGSGNWSSGAGTRYDENTLFVNGGEAKLAFLLQREFNHLWDHSRDFVSAPFEHERSSLAITDAMIGDRNPDADILFTSPNFDVNGTTFRGNGGNAVADRWVEAIANARTSIHIASGHLRSRPVAEALEAKRRANPGVEIKVYLDGQEYVSRSGHAEQVADRNACIAAAAGNVAKIRDCNDKGFLFGYEVSNDGVDVRYKYYSYRWNNAYAAQMHNKYMIVDGSTLFTGSYNLSDNAEHETFENVFVFRGSKYAALVDQYERNFQVLWRTGDGKLPALLESVRTSNDVPIVFDALSLDWAQVTDLKAKIRAACPAVDSEEYRRNAARYRTCTR
jgi:phosphatidylserine/phosphatidylglycerophosphate/cardiolipin synthase-like enzyme